MSSRLPPSVGVQLKCHPYSFYWGSRIFPASSALASSAPSLEPLPGHAAPWAYLPGRPGAAPVPQRRQDPRGSFNNTGTFPRPGAASAQAPPPAQAPGPSRGSSTSELRPTSPPGVTDKKRRPAEFLRSRSERPGASSERRACVLERRIGGDPDGAEVAAAGHRRARSFSDIKFCTCNTVTED
ncbi:hypothetical protein NDU88_001884 [Pleurodeles waltl]|uniref:Uncharacterized protein n=1 Tax=Pleurodeles waltl TaxID=8319 RepID=A0AAV7VXR9_PLEWA|nr:hypothetical protein NDU88_001884 [Pleurodeles waltl]